MHRLIYFILLLLLPLQGTYAGNIIEWNDLREEHTLLSEDIGIVEDTTNPYFIKDVMENIDNHKKKSKDRYPDTREEVIL